MTDRDSGPDPLADLFTDLATGVTRLIRGEIALARAEAGQVLAGIGRALAQLAVALVFGLVALLVLALAAVAGLEAWGLARGWSLLAVGAVLLLLACGAAAAALRRMQALRHAPGRALDGLRRDLDILTQGRGADDAEPRYRD